MRIKIIEDHPGEVLGLTGEEIVAKLYAGMSHASELLLKGKAERGGEIDALETLRESLHKGFAARLAEIRAEISASHAVEEPDQDV